MQVKIKRVQFGINEDGVPILGPETPPPHNYTECLIQETEYVYTVPDPKEPCDNV